MHDQLATAQAAITDHGNRLAMLRGIVNHPCNRVVR
jgi:hypothetical protein